MVVSRLRRRVDEGLYFFVSFGRVFGRLLSARREAGEGGRVSINSVSLEHLSKGCVCSYNMDCVLRVEAAAT